MDPLSTAAKNPFVEVDLARINPEGLIMDDKKPDEVASGLEEMHNAGKGVIGMKIFGEGQINTSPNAATPRSATSSAWARSTPSSSASRPTEQIDDILTRTADAIAFLKA